VWCCSDSINHYHRTTLEGEGMKMGSGWTQMMNKKQYEKTAGNKAKNKSLYTITPSYKKRQEKLRTDRFLLGVGVSIITLVLALGVWMIWAVVTL